MPRGVTKALYPCYMPEWLETTRTSRMCIIAVAKVADPKACVRRMGADITGFVTMTRWKAVAAEIQSPSASKSE